MEIKFLNKNCFFLKKNINTTKKFFSHFFNSKKMYVEKFLYSRMSRNKSYVFTIKLFKIKKKLIKS